MLDRESAQRPAQVNACFAGGSDRIQEIVGALRQTGLSDDRITVIERAMPEKTDIDHEHDGGFLDRLKSLFGGGDHDDAEHHSYDTIVMAHLGHDEHLAGPVREVFGRFGAARVNYYPPANVEMHVLGGADPLRGTSLATPNENTADGAGVPTNADPSTAARPVRPGQAEPEPVESRTLDRMEPGLAPANPTAMPLYPPNDLLANEAADGRPPEAERRDANTRE